MGLNRHFRILDLDFLMIIDDSWIDEFIDLDLLLLEFWGLV